MKHIKLNGMDGSHWGLSDWYPDFEKDIKNALIKSDDFTTDWYSSKKEIASAKITLENGKVTVEVSVSNDFDENGYAKTEIDFPRYSIRYNIRTVQDAICPTWDRAIDDQKENSIVGMYQILNPKGHWVETFLADKDPYAMGMESPPGDFYYQWGWQEEAKLPKVVKENFEEAIYSGTKKTEYRRWKCIEIK